MRIGRRAFLQSAAGAIPALGRAAGQGGPLPESKPVKNWIWIPTRAERPVDQWKRSFALMRSSGIRAILPEIYDGRSAYFESTRLPVKTNWLATLLPLASAEGLEVHAWMWTMPCLIEDIMKKHPDWYNVNARGESAVDKPAYVDYYRFLDPGRPEVREWVQGTVKELAAIDGLAGIHLDYVRHPDAILPVALWKKYNIVQDRVYPRYDYGYTEYERAQFKQKYGVDPLAIKDRKLQDAWLQFRWDMVTGLVNGYLVPAAHGGGKVITAAVFPGPTLARINVRQDWGRWDLDAFLPMLYNSFYNAGPEWVGEETKEAVSTVKKPVYSGLFVGGELDEPTFTQTAEVALHTGASGISIFSDDAMDDAKWKALKEITTARRG